MSIGGTPLRIHVSSSAPRDTDDSLLRSPYRLVSYEGRGSSVVGFREQGPILVERAVFDVVTGVLASSLPANVQLVLISSRVRTCSIGRPVHLETSRRGDRRVVRRSCRGGNWRVGPVSWRSRVGSTLGAGGGVRPSPRERRARPGTSKRIPNSPRSWRTLSWR